MITTREIADDESSISSTRWAFVTVVKFDCIIIALVLLSGLASHFVPSIEDIDSSFYGAVAVLLGVLTSLVVAPKALQGFEPYKKGLSTTPENLKKVSSTQIGAEETTEEIAVN